MTTWFVSRHPGALEWAAQQGLRVDRQVTHLEPAQVRAGDTVIGTLPIQLAAAVCAQGAHFYNLSLDLPALWRGRELSAGELVQCNARLERYDVRTPAIPLSKVGP
jgi:CRISPR-associated protein Csx16